MAATLETISSLTDRYQTTVPAVVRKALKLQKHDKIRFLVQEDGVLLTRLPSKEESGTDPMLRRFLQFLAQDMEANPGHLQPVTAKWLKHAQSLVQGVKVNLNAPLNPADE